MTVSSTDKCLNFSGAHQLNQTLLPAGLIRCLFSIGIINKTFIVRIADIHHGSKEVFILSKSAMIFLGIENLSFNSPAPARGKSTPAKWRFFQ
jgi:hypothetical protein